MKKHIAGFTLIEILLGIVIFAFVLVGGLAALSFVTGGKVRLIEGTNMVKDVNYFSERLFQEIKQGGTIDFEEYFNRKVIGTGISSGHYLKSSGYGNYGQNDSTCFTRDCYGKGYYFCRSGSGMFMGTGGCFSASSPDFSATNAGEPFGAKIGDQQRYGQYAFQFIDYNGNRNADLYKIDSFTTGVRLGDEDGDGFIRGDDDDEHLGAGPVAFTGGVNVWEIYLISGDRKTRTYFRWNIKQDPYNSIANCASSIYKFKEKYEKDLFLDATSQERRDALKKGGCLGTIEMLKLVGRDWGMKHDKSSSGAYDGIIDTWIVDPSFGAGTGTIATLSNTDQYWQPLFPETINVTDFSVFMYPNTDTNYAWRDVSDESNINPYLRLSITLEPGSKKWGNFKQTQPPYTITTTINLVDYFSQ